MPPCRVAFAFAFLPVFYCSAARAARIESPPDATAPAASGVPLEAGAADEVFFVRSADGSFVLMPSGRFEYDFYAFEGGSRQPPNAFLPKRVRLEAFGNILKRYDFQIGAEYTGGAPVVADAYVSAEIVRDRRVNLQIGQFDAPFTMDNRTSDKFFDMQERSLVVRTFGFPENKENGAMVWGQPAGKWAWYGVGIFNGEGIGQGLAHNQKNFCTIGRAWFSPFGLAGIAPLRNVWIGASGFTGNPRPNVANQQAFPPFKTVGGFTFISTSSAPTQTPPTATGLYGYGNRFAGEINVPVGQFVLKAEALHVDEAMREFTTAPPIVPFRNALAVGDGQYVRLSWFVWGDPLINGLGGMETPPRLGVLQENKTGDALQLAIEVDHLRFQYRQFATPTLTANVTNFGTDVGTAGIKYWQTKHVHWTANFSYYDFLGASVSPLESSRHSYEVTTRFTLAF
jgi:phosphate-selective porin